jgi:hypothetical protein
MNAIDRLITDEKERGEVAGDKATPIEKLILSCGNPTLRLQAAAQWMVIHGRATYQNFDDMTELNTTAVE